ncbi:MAG: glycosyltransferase family 4 protein [Pseudomonadota bacterium]
MPAERGSPSINPTVLHLIPQDGIGGAEIAARSATLDLDANVHVHAMFNGLYTGEGATANPHLTGNDTGFAFSPKSLSGAIRTARELDPAVVVFSLWRTFGAFVAFKLLFRKCKFVTFVHNERVANPVDRIVTAIMRAFSDEIWVDSQATLDARLSPSQKQRSRIISLKLDRPAATPRQSAEPKFIYWGRLAQQKRIDRAIDLFAAVANSNADARFLLAGPDHGVKADLLAQAEKLGIADRVTILDPVGRDEIADLAKDARFFLQLSDHEGMAMGVVEALQHALVPVVTPVGQMAVYCKDGENALIFDGHESTAKRLAGIMADRDAYAEMSAAALATFADDPIYVEDVVAAARELAA